MLPAQFFRQARRALENFETCLENLFFGRKFSPGLCALPLTDCQLQKTPGNSIFDVLNNAILYAVPKSRRTIEKRRNRKFGWPEYVWKPLVPKTNIIMCTTCGFHHEAGSLCGNCYERIKKETEEMQKAIDATLKLEPIEKEVVVLYEDEIQSVNEDYWKGKRIVEMKKKRPPWFSDNLLQKSTSRESNNEDLKPTELA